MADSDLLVPVQSDRGFGLLDFKWIGRTRSEDTPSVSDQI
jgi:hypothetical protein